MRTIAQLLFFSALLATGTSLHGGEAKLGGQGPSGTALLPAFLNSDKTWYRDAMQAYHGSDMTGADGPMARAGFTLTLLQHHWLHHEETYPEGNYVAFDPFLALRDGNVLVEALCAEEADREAMASAFLAHGASGVSWEGRLLSAWIPCRKLDAFVGVGGLHGLRPSYFHLDAGVIASQGDAALEGPAGRALDPGFDGSGLTIGTLSDSFDRATAPTDASADVASGDLPSGIEVLAEPGGAASDEGRAMMQIVHDLAPGAEQKFHTAFNGQTGFAQGIRALAAQGCNIIVDDVFYFAEPFFQNGVIAQAVNEVREAGVLYFSAAGNSGTNAYEAAFRPLSTITGLSGGPLHDFDAGPGEDAFLRFTLPVGQSVTFVLQWDEPFFSVSGGAGAQNDVDLIITGSGDGRLSALTGSLADNLNGDPLEIVTLSNSGSINVDGQAGADTEFNLVFELFTGTPPGRLKVIFFGGTGFNLLEHATESSTLVGHANAEGAIAVGAAPYFNTPAFEVAPPVLAPFSSPGGTPLLFDEEGTRLQEPLLTGQPKIVAADGGNTTFFGTDLSPGFPSEADTFPNFFGTSAAAPHAAAVAALILEKAGGPGSLSPGAVEALLVENAIDMGDPGIDLASGGGLIDAEASLRNAPLGFSTFARRHLEPAGLPPDPSGNPDQDQLPNILEFFTGSDPRSPDAGAPVDVNRTIGGIELFLQVGGEVNPALGRIEQSTDLQQWTALEIDLLQGANRISFPQPEEEAFYRVAVEETPSATP